MPKDVEVYFSLESVLKQLNAGISPNGGIYTMDALAQNLEGCDNLSVAAKRNLVRRTLEWSKLVHAGKEVPMFIGIWTDSGKLTTPRPFGVRPVEDRVMFEPDDQNEEDTPNAQ